MNVIVCETKADLGKMPAQHGADLIRKAIEERGYANIIVATGTSQFEMLNALIKQDVAWNNVTAFHLDEYIGLPITHGASFRKYLWERFVSKLPLPLNAFHYCDGERDPKAECKRLSDEIKKHPIDVAFVGIGENGHLAFNDPPADFETDEPYLVVNLDEACRKQQMGEGWFPTLNDVPRHAISMSCRQILNSRTLIITCPDERKAKAVQGSVEGPVSNLVPGSIMQGHRDATLYLDTASASLLGKAKPFGRADAADM
jgi:glucosamine-6-phosphate deaminase